MSIETDGRRTVEHRITARLSDNDRFIAVHGGWGQAKGKDFLVEVVRWPGGYRSGASPMEPDSTVNLSGFLYRKDGSLGQRQGSARMQVRDLPEPVRDAMLAKCDEVYAP